MDFTSFVIVTPAALVILKFMSVHRTHFSKTYSFAVKKIICGEMQAFWLGTNYSWNRMWWERLVTHRSLLCNKRKLILWPHLSVYASVAWSVSRRKEWTYSPFISKPRFKALQSHWCKWIWISYLKSSEYFPLSSDSLIKKCRTILKHGAQMVLC